MKQKTYLQNSLRNIWNLICLGFGIKNKRQVRLERYLDKDISKSEKEKKDIVTTDTSIQKLNNYIKKQDRLVNELCINNSFYATSEELKKLNRLLEQKYMYILFGCRNVKLWNVNDLRIIAVNEKNALRKYRNIKQGKRLPFNIADDFIVYTKND